MKTNNAFDECSQVEAMNTFRFKRAFWGTTHKFLDQVTFEAATGWAMLRLFYEEYRTFYRDHFSCMCSLELFDECQWVFIFLRVPIFLKIRKKLLFVVVDVACAIIW